MARAGAGAPVAKSVSHEFSRLWQPDDRHHHLHRDLRAEATVADGVAVVTDENQRSRRGRQTAASPRRSTRRWTDPAWAAVPLREAKQQRAPEYPRCLLRSARSCLEQADGRRGGSLKRQWVDAAPRCSYRPAAVVTSAATARALSHKGNRLPPAGPDECKGDISIVRCRWTSQTATFVRARCSGRCRLGLRK